jgi:hypothetical protein
VGGKFNTTSTTKKEITPMKLFFGVIIVLAIFLLLFKSLGFELFFSGYHYCAPNDDIPVVDLIDRNSDTYKEEVEKFTSSYRLAEERLLHNLQVHRNLRAAQLGLLPPQEIKATIPWAAHNSIGHVRIQINMWVLMFNSSTENLTRLGVDYNTRISPSVIDYLRQHDLHIPNIRIPYDPIREAAGSAINR